MKGHTDPLARLTHSQPAPSILQPCKLLPAEHGFRAVFDVAATSAMVGPSPLTSKSYLPQAACDAHGSQAQQFARLRQHRDIIKTKLTCSALEVHDVSAAACAAAGRTLCCGD
eukprot:366431-Chlamydomonas_euryale.AAC.17